MKIIAIIIIVVIVLAILVWDHTCFTTEDEDSDEGEERPCYHVGDW